MAPEAHDRALAAFSHLPHVLAFSLTAQSQVAAIPRALFAGLGSFRSATRVAASSPEMWRDIFLENRKPLLIAVDRQAREIASLRKKIAAGDGAGLLRYLSAAQDKRRKIP
jgi:prephenate dehydrogenase